MDTQTLDIFKVTFDDEGKILSCDKLVNSPEKKDEEENSHEEKDKKLCTIEDAPEKTDEVLVEKAKEEVPPLKENPEKTSCKVCGKNHPDLPPFSTDDDIDEIFRKLKENSFPSTEIKSENDEIWDNFLGDDIKTEISLPEDADGRMTSILKNYVQLIKTQIIFLNSLTKKNTKEDETVGILTNFISEYIEKSTLSLINPYVVSSFEMLKSIREDFGDFNKFSELSLLEKDRYFSDKRRKLDREKMIQRMMSDPFLLSGLIFGEYRKPTRPTHLFPF